MAAGKGAGDFGGVPVDDARPASWSGWMKNWLIFSGVAIRSLLSKASTH